MSENTLDYANLVVEDTWVAYFRTRLPYSFRDVRKVNHRYILSGPQLSTQWAEFHNFWQRGSVYYAAGKLVDIHGLHDYWREYSNRYDPIVLKHPGLIPLHMRRPAQQVVNALQLEKLWTVAGYDHLDRERVTMTNISQAIEYCLKALQTHAEHHRTGVFAFIEGHDLKALYNFLPADLRRELHLESVTFAGQYRSCRQILEEIVAQLDKDFLVEPDPAIWSALRDRISTTTYTCFIGANDPPSVESLGCTPETWLDIAIDSIGQSTYHRYSPFQGKDTYPTTPIHRGLMLGRFFYEHLFPVPEPNKTEKS